jgi:hypothetical protein
VSIWTLLFGFISLYRCVNLFRILENRANSNHLRKITPRSSVVLISLQLFDLIAQYYWAAFTGLYVLVIVQILVAILFFMSTLRSMRKTQLFSTSDTLAVTELPTVTVAIPARNETDVLEESLHALIASDYPKLEILVLDDCSQTRRTPEIIRSFAHDGVRFLKGIPPKENWLAKNQAYEQLSDAASGDIILFCGVDMRFASGTIRQLVTEMLGREKRMMSVVPMRESEDNLQYSFVQAARYLWELAPPRRLFRRPPVLSSCWMIYRKDLKRFGGFDAASRMIIPEAYFAKQLLAEDGYSFIRANHNLGLVSAKSYEAQRQTAVRTRYPQLHRRPENVMALTLFELACFIGPLGLLILSLLGKVPLAAAFFAGVSLALLTACNVMVTVSTGLQSWYVAFVGVLPVAVVDIFLMNLSMQRYEFSEVLWKGRNVCIPIMHVYPSLPKLNDLVIADSERRP